MKKISVIFGMIILCLSGCSNGTSSVSDTEIEYDNIQTDLEEESVQKLTLTDISVEGVYSDGCVWIYLSSNEYSGLDGIVNKDGEVIAAIPTKGYVNKEYKGHSKFKDGYAFLFFDTEIHVLDTNGDIISTQQLGEDRQLAAHGAGYIVIKNHVHDFDYNLYEYIFYNPQGEEVAKYNIPDDGKEHRVSYIGGGVFDIGVDDGHGTNDIYFSRVNKWVQNRISPASGEDSSKLISSKWNNSSYITFGKSNKGILTSSEQGNGICIADTDGNITEYPIEINDITVVRNYSAFCDNYCLVVDELDSGGGCCASVLDLNTGFQTVLGDEYKVDIQGNAFYYGKGPAIYSDNNMFSIPLEGKDGKCYIGIFDVNCNLISDPIRIDDWEHYSFSDERLVVKQENDNVEVYSVDGQEIFTLNGSYKDQPGYSDGVLVDVNSELENIGVYDLDGNKLYSRLDTADTKILFEE